MINAISIIPGNTDYCPTMGDLAIKKRMNVPWGKHKRGDIVLFDFNGNGTSDHIGIVVAVNGKSITTIEGNTGSGNDTNGGAVQQRTRYKYQVNYFIRPKYNEQVTADMLIATAKDELGNTESPKNSNKVKYNRWFYGSNKSAYWCCTFVCWCFAHIKTDEDRKPKPGTYTGEFPTRTLQKGDKGAQVKKWQKFLRWMGYDLEADADFGSITKKYTVKAQKKFGFKGKDVDGIVGPKTIKAAKKYVKKKTDKPSVKPSETPKMTDIRTLHKVIDISYWQSTSDLKTAKKDGVDGVIIRTSYTSQSSFSLNKDSRFATHIKHAIEAGLPIGVYHYSQAITAKEAKKEAEFIINIIKPYKKHITLPVVIDWEFGGRLNSKSARKLGVSGCNKLLSTFCDYVKKNGYTPMIYANFSTFYNYTSLGDLQKKYLIWLAQYAKKASIGYDLWQYTSDGSVKGVPGRVDVSKGSSPKIKTPKTPAEKAVIWAEKIAKDGSYTYKKWDNNDPKTKQCPICHDLKGKYKGWNCIGFVSAALYHGAGLKDITCSCSGIGTNSFFEGITLTKWEQRNGKGWRMIGNGGKEGGKSLPESALMPGDVIICYDKKGTFHHVALYAGAGKYIDCTNTHTPHIGIRKYADLCGRYRVTRAFRYVG